MNKTIISAVGAVGAVGLLAACAPTVKLEAPDKPIEINLNVKIDQEVRIKLDREVESLIADNPDLF
ncbi:MAG: YnbE family lipoprotein [Hyphomonadaceae bacterium]